VTLKSRLGVTQDGWKWHHSIDRIGVSAGKNLGFMEKKPRFFGIIFLGF